MALVSYFNFSRFFESNRRWAVFFVVFLSGAFTIGMNVYSFGLFVEPLENEFNWNREQVSLGYAISFVTSLVAPLVGRFVDIKGSKIFLIGSLVLVGLGFILRPFMTSLTHWILLNALVFAGYPGTLMITSGVLIQVWFPKSRGRMVGITTAGNNFGGLIFPPLTFVILSRFGWQSAYFFYGVLVLTLALLAIFLVRNNPNKSTDSKIGDSKNYFGLNINEALRSKQFYTLTLGITFACFTYNGIMPQMIPHLHTEGLSISMATLAMTYIALMGMLSKFIFGRLSEKISSLFLMSISVAIQGLALAIILIADGNIWVIWLGILIFGMGFGGLGALIVLTITECFGLKSFSTLYGLLSFLGIWATFIAPWMMGRIFDSTSSYRSGHWITLLIFSFGILMLVTTKFMNKNRNFLIDD